MEKNFVYQALGIVDPGFVQKCLALQPTSVLIHFIDANQKNVDMLTRGVYVGHTSCNAYLLTKVQPANSLYIHLEKLQITQIDLFEGSASEPLMTLAPMCEQDASSSRNSVWSFDSEKTLVNDNFTVHEPMLNMTIQPIYNAVDINEEEPQSANHRKREPGVAFKSWSKIPLVKYIKRCVKNPHKSFLEKRKRECTGEARCLRDTNTTHTA